MKLHLTKTELPALTEVLERLIIENVGPFGILSIPDAFVETRLIITNAKLKVRNEVICALLIIKLYKKLKEKCALIDKKKYSINVEPESQLAFIHFLQGVRIPVTTFSGQLTHRVLTEFYRSTSNLTS
jgi:hypothetical protein